MVLRSVSTEGIMQLRGQQMPLQAVLAMDTAVLCPAAESLALPPEEDAEETPE